MTVPPPEIRLVSVSWRGPGEVTGVRSSRFPLPLHEAGPGEWVGTTTTYPDVEGAPAQLGVLGDPGGPPPLVERRPGDETERKLSPVHDKEGRTWWIERGPWDSRGYHLDPTVNTGGDVSYRVGGSRVVIDVVSSALSPEEFDEMVGEFRDGLWGLVLDDTRSTTVERKRSGSGGGEPFTQAVRALADAVGHAVRMPHSELRETTVWSRPDRARPSSKTFQEIARRGTPRVVPGRGHTPTHDTPENRSLLGMVARIERAVRASQRAAEARANDFEVRSSRVSARLSHEVEGKVWLPESGLRSDLANLQAQESEWRKAMERVSTGTFSEHGEGRGVDQTVSVSRSWTTRDGGVRAPYFCHADYCQVSTVLEGGGTKRLVELVLRFKASRNDLERAFPERVAGWTFPLRGRLVQVGDKQEWDKKVKYTFYVVELNPVERGPFHGEISALESLLRAVEVGPTGVRGAWRTLAPKEAVEQDRATASAEKSVERYDAAAREWRGRSRGLEALGDRLRQVRRALTEGLGVSDQMETDAVAFGSMTYVHNPHYRAALGAYRRAVEKMRLDEGTVDRLFALDDVGVLDLPTVYERWVLLQLVRVLTEDFGFVTEHAGAVVDALTSVRGRRPLQVRLVSEAYRRRLDLYYQPRMTTATGRRQPDYVVALRPWDKTGLRPRVMVMDAKFKPFAPLDRPPVLGEGDLAAQIDELILEKDYWQGQRNRVYVVHPGPRGVTADEGARYTALGGEPVSRVPSARLNWDRERYELPDRLDHDVGAVLVRPGSRDDLRRLVLMHLMEGLHDTQGSALSQSEDALPPVCPGCGGALLDEPDLEYKYDDDGNRQYAVRAVYRCGRASCGHESVRTYCANPWCLRHLWKLGAWNYHATRPMDPFDVKCPGCTTYRPVYAGVPTAPGSA